VSIWTDPPPRQQTLDRDAIVAAAIATADESGAAAVTMKAVADRLGGYTPMALYRYVHNKNGLIDLMLDAATAEVPLEPGEWRPALRRLALATRAMIKRHPWYAELVHTRPPAGPHQMAHLELMLTALTEAGATLPEAMTHAAMIARHIYGSGLQEATEARTEPAELMPAIAEMHQLAEGRYPTLARWLANPSGPSPDDQFEQVLGFLLDGIASRLPG
jgi:AcrR family transcriptional regulator